MNHKSQPERGYSVIAKRVEKNIFSSQDEIDLLWYVNKMLEEFNEIETTLAQALGYTYYENHGFAIGDHTPVTLAMEAKERIENQKKVIRAWVSYGVRER